MHTELTKKDRVRAAIAHQRPDRTPKGDLAIEQGLLRKLIGEERYDALSPNERMLTALTQLDADLVNIHQFPMEQVGENEKGQPIFRSVLGDEHVITANSSHLVKPAIADIAEVDAYLSPDPATCLTDTLDWFRDHSDLFLFAQVMGPISSLDWMLSTEDFMIYSMTDTEAIVQLAEKVITYEISRAKTFLDHGADAIMITDDMAFNSGLFLPPQIMDQLAWPLYKRMVTEIKAHRDVPVFLHTDGDINRALGNIVDCGFDGLQSLQPSAGMDIESVKEQYGAQLCLMGNMDLDQLMTFSSPDEVTKQARWLCETIGQDGGFILSTCNILIDAIPVENARAMYGSVNNNNE